MNNHLGDEAKKKVLDETEGETWLGPIVAPLKNVQHVPIEIHLTVKIFFLECLDRNQFLAVVRVPVFSLIKFQVVLYGPAWQLGFFILARCKFGCKPPERSQNREA